MMQLTLTINTNAFPEYSKSQLHSMLGLLPLWVAEHVGNDDDTDLVQFMTDRYGFGKLYEFEGKINEDGDYISKYDDDADMPYMGKMITKDGYAYFYDYAIIALPQPDGKHFITRMD
jgi:hypothetical protein